MVVAALPLAALWRANWARSEPVRLAARGAALGAVALIAAISVHDYFWTWRRSEFARYVYHSEITAASEYMRALPRGTYVCFYSDRHPLSLETRQFLAPDVRGEDRSREFSRKEGSIAIDVAEPVAFVLLGPYAALLPSLEEAYPGGREVAVERDGAPMFVAYEVDAGRTNVR
jgi:hypothetical protein